MSQDELRRLRVDRATDNTKITPQDLLRYVADEIDAGRLKCDGVVVLTAHRPESENWEFDTYRANVRRDEELVVVTMAQERCIRNWREKG